MDLIRQYDSFESLGSNNNNSQKAVDQENLSVNNESKFVLIVGFLFDVYLFARLIDRNSGRGYSTAKKKEIPPRKCTVLLDCKKMCRLNITREEQLNNFNSYWEKGEYLKRKNYIKQLINVHPKQRSRGNDIKNRHCSATYQLYGQRGKIDVCRGCFLLTLGESKSFVEDVVGKLWQDEKSVEIEARGRNTPPNKTSDEKLEEVQNHIEKFPAYESHYSRAHTSKKYLQPNLNISIMYNMYTEETTDPVSLTIYRQEFKKTGLKFKSPQIDTCRRCDEYKTSLKYEKDDTKRREIEKKPSSTGC